MLANISTSGSNNVDNNLQHSTGNTINNNNNVLNQNQPQHHQHQHQHQHQQQQQQHPQQQQHQHQFDQQPTTTQHDHRQEQHQPPLPNQPKTRGRRKKIRTEPIRPVCPQCEKQFSNQSALTKHKLTHSDERKFACHQCSKAFKRHDHLTGHMQTHSNRKPFNCTIQGCDKTYCDARSLRRHKENIHHIVTQTQEPSHLLRRRIQRLHSDQGIYNRSVEHHQLNCVTAPPHSLPPLQGSLTPHQVSTTSTLTPTPNGNSNSGGHQSASYLNHHNHANPHGSYSADYASTQHFNFDFVPMSGGSVSSAQSSHNLNHHHHHHHHSASQHGYHHHDANYHLEHQATSLDHSLDNGSMPLSADSVTDSGLGLNVCYEQHTPQPLAPPPPPPRSSYNQNLQHHQHQLNCATASTHSLQPSQASSTPHRVSTTTTLTPTPNSNSNSGGHQSASYLNHHNHTGPHGSYSADYASTQHFNFDFVPMNSVSSAQSTHNLNHHNHHSASQHGYHHDTNYNNLDHQVTSLEHSSGTGSMPLSADSVTDSGLGLNVYYEQHTPQPLAPQPPSFRL